MWMRDAFVLRQYLGAKVLLHIYEKKKHGLCAASPASSFFKYADSDDGHKTNREGNL